MSTNDAPQHDRDSIEHLVDRLREAHIGYINALHHNDPEREHLEGAGNALREAAETLRERLQDVSRLLEAAERSVGMRRSDDGLVKVPILTMEELDQQLDDGAGPDDADDQT